MVAYEVPRPPKGSQKRNPLIIPQLPQCRNGFILGGGGFHVLDPLGGLGRRGLESRMLRCVGKFHRAGPHALLQASIGKHFVRRKASPMTVCVCMSLQAMIWFFSWFDCATFPQKPAPSPEQLCGERLLKKHRC